jgi:hypothetical protein
VAQSLDLGEHQVEKPQWRKHRNPVTAAMYPNSGQAARPMGRFGGPVSIVRCRQGGAALLAYPAPQRRDDQAPSTTNRRMSKHTSMVGRGDRKGSPGLAGTSVRRGSSHFADFAATTPLSRVPADSWLSPISRPGAPVVHRGLSRARAQNGDGMPPTAASARTEGEDGLAAVATRVVVVMTVMVMVMPVVPRRARPDGLVRAGSGRRYGRDRRSSRSRWRQRHGTGEGHPQRSKQRAQHRRLLL